MRKIKKKEIAYANLNIGFIYERQGEYDKALELYKISLEIYTELTDTLEVANCLNNFGVIHKKLGKYNEALGYYQEALSLCEQIGDKRGESFCMNNIGLIHKKQNNYDKALKYFEKSLEINIEMQDTNAIAGANINIGRIYKEQKNYNKALEYLREALILLKKIKNKRGILYCYKTIGDIYTSTNDYQQAISYYEKSLPIIEKLGDKNAKVGTLNDLAFIYNQLADSTGNNQNYSIALNYALEALDIANQMKALPRINEAYAVLYSSYEGLQNYKLAFEYSQKFIQTNDSLFNKEKTKAIEELEAIYQNEKKQQEIEKQDLLLEKKDLEAKKRNIQLIAFIVGFALMIILAFMSFMSYRRKHRDNILIQTQNAELMQANEEIIAQKDLLQEQKDKIEKIHKQITDSILYAERIQHAALPSQDVLDDVLGNYFVLFKPLHIVSGDFFWAKRVGDYKIFTAADCTGHGVPGAFVSMLGVSFLAEIVRRKNVTQASQILELLREEIKTSLKQTGDFNESKDGMDMALCMINVNTNELQYAGANNPLIFIRENKLTEYKSTRNPVAIYLKEKPFENNIIKIQKNDIIYLFSDGFADQHGGPKDRKFMKKQFKKLLLDIHQEKLTKQKEILITELKNWTGKESQVDDILVMGVKF